MVLGERVTGGYVPREEAQVRFSQNMVWSGVRSGVDQVIYEKGEMKPCNYQQPEPAESMVFWWHAAPEYFQHFQWFFCIICWKSLCSKMRNFVFPTLSSSFLGCWLSIIRWEIVRPLLQTNILLSSLQYIITTVTIARWYQQVYIPESH